MKIVTIDAYNYIGYLSVPAINLELPVMVEWSYPGLKISPGRYSGAVYTRNRVIAVHNYVRHFRPIKWLDWIWKYKVVSTETLNPTQVKEMVTKTESDTWDLTLFTCNTGGQTRCTVCCEEIESTE